MKIFLPIILLFISLNSCVNAERDNPIDQKAGNYDPDYRGSHSITAWKIKSPMPTKRAESGVVELNGKIYVFGGIDFSLNPVKYYDILEVYDIASDSWTTKSSMYHSSSGFSAAAINGQIYAISYVSKVQVYNPYTDTWSLKADVPSPRSQQAGAVLNGKLYTVGGVNSNTIGISTIVEVYDPVSNSWTTKTPMPTARNCLCVSAVNGKLYAIGGFGSDGFSLNTVEEYNPSSDSWTSKSKMPSYRGGATCSAYNNKIYVIGGTTPSSFYSSIVEIYDTSTDTWISGGSINLKRSWLSGSSTLDGKIFAVGGQTETNGNQIFSNMVEELTLNGDLYPPAVSGITPATSTTPTWTWDSVPGAVKYRYGFTFGQWISENSTSTSYTPLTALSPGDYTLYVQAGDSSGKWSGSGSFTIRIQSPVISYFEIYGASVGDYTLTTSGHQLIGNSNEGNSFKMTGYGRFILYIPSTSSQIYFDAIGLDSGWVNSQPGIEYAHHQLNMNNGNSFDSEIEGPPDSVTIENKLGMDSYYGFSTMGASTLTIHTITNK